MNDKEKATLQKVLARIQEARPELVDKSMSAAKLKCANAETTEKAETLIRSTKGLLDQATEIGVLILKHSLQNETLATNAFFEANIVSSKDKGLKAGTSPGSPQLDSFGPEVDLANELLQKGKREDVIAYLNSIKSFWKSGRGRVNKWLMAIDSGENPKLDRF